MESSNIKVKSESEIENENGNNNNNNNNNNNKKQKLIDDRDDIYDNASEEEKIFDAIKQYSNYKQITIDGNNVMPIERKKYIFAQICNGIDTFYFENYKVSKVKVNLNKYDYSTVDLSGGNIALLGGNGDGKKLNLSNTAGFIDLPTIQLFNVTNKTFKNIGKMNIARSSFATILLRDGRVFIAGGDNKKDDVFDSCELFNPSNNDCVICKTFMKQKRNYPAVGLLPNGNPIVFGGRDCEDEELDSTEIYDVLTDSFKDGPVMLHKRYGHTATTLFTGEILICGGYGEWQSTEIYNPRTNTFREGPPLTYRWSHHYSCLLPDGKALIFGEIYFGTAAEIYDPKKNTFSVITYFSQ